MQRRCKKCDNIFPLNSDYFYSDNKNGKTYYKHICIECSCKKAKNNYYGYNNTVQVKHVTSKPVQVKHVNNDTIQVKHVDNSINKNVSANTSYKNVSTNTSYKNISANNNYNNVCTNSNNTVQVNHVSNSINKNVSDNTDYKKPSFFEIYAEIVAKNKNVSAKNKNVHTDNFDIKVENMEKTIEGIAILGKGLKNLFFPANKKADKKPAINENKQVTNKNKFGVPALIPFEYETHIY